MPRSRRSLLEATAAAVGSGLFAATAGCLGRSPTGAPTEQAGSDQTTTTETARSGTDTAVPTPPASVMQWLPNPATTTFPDGYGVRYFDAVSIRAARDSMHPAAYDRLRRQFSRPIPGAVDPEQVDATLGLDHILEVAFGSFDPDALAEELTSLDRSSSTATPTTATRTPWPEPARYGGFQLYGQDRVYALSESVVFSVRPFYEGDPVAYAKALIDTAADASGHYADGNSSVASMFGVVENSHALRCYPEAMDGSTSRGFRTDSITGQLTAWRFGSEKTRLTYANTYIDAETAADGELREFIEANEARFEPYEGIDVSIEDRLAWTHGTIPTAEFDHLSAGGPGDSVTTPN